MVVALGGAEFSWFSASPAAGLAADFGFDDLLDFCGAVMLTCLRCLWVRDCGFPALLALRKGRGGDGAYVKLPPLEVLARVLVRDDDDQLRDLAVLHPAVQRGHDLLDVRLDLVVGRDEHVQPVLFDDGEVLGRVDAALVEDGVDGVLELRKSEAAGQKRGCPLEVVQRSRGGVWARRDVRTRRPASRCP